MDQFDEIIKEFLVESYESLDSLDRDLVALEDNPADRDRLASIFRTVHTIKGTSGFLAFPKLERVAHVSENLLVPLRDGELDLTNDIADGLLGMVDAIRSILAQVESIGAEGDEEYAALIERLENLRSPQATPAEPPTAEPVETEQPDSAADASAVKQKTTRRKTASGTTKGRSTKKKSARRKTTKKAEVEQDPDVESGDGSAESTGATAPDPAPAVTADPASEETKPASTSAPAAEGAAERGSSSLADSTVRIDVSLLDKLMNLVGELVLARNQILQFGHNSEDPTIVAASQRLNLITTELQEGVMKTRMQPIRNAWSKLPRVVRDLSSTCGKQVQLRMEGADTELDKTILEAIKDPLTHIVRNSVDHGIEASEVREQNGKPAEGTLWLRAFHEGGQVNIEIADDGGGINLERVRDKAVERGLVTTDQVAGMNDRELTNLILLPGFSTAEKVTNVSGRGVGMDVVKTNIERIGGSLEVQSTPGQGTTLRIKIPLTLAIVPALVVTAGNDQYAIPQVSLLELVRLDGERARDQIELIYDAPVYRLRGNLLPLVYLDEELGLRVKRAEAEHGDANAVNIVVLQAEDRQFGLVVDAINDTQEIVVKPLGRHLKSITTYAGTTIMGDGAVALILDVIGLAQQSDVLSEHRDHSRLEAANRRSDHHADRESLLIVDQGDGSRAAICLSTVARLEEFPKSAVEQSGQGDVVQYRGRIMPLIHLSHATAGMGSAYGEDVSDRLHVVVYTVNNQSVGVVVGRILDVVEAQSARRDDAESGQDGAMIIQERVTQVVDLEAMVRSQFPGLFDQFNAA